MCMCVGLSITLALYVLQAVHFVDSSEEASAAVDEAFGADVRTPWNKMFSQQ